MHDSDMIISNLLRPKNVFPVTFPKLLDQRIEKTFYSINNFYSFMKSNSTKIFYFVVYPPFLDKVICGGLLET